MPVAIDSNYPHHRTMLAAAGLAMVPIFPSVKHLLDLVENEYTTPSSIIINLHDYGNDRAKLQTKLLEINEAYGENDFDLPVFYMITGFSVVRFCPHSGNTEELHITDLHSKLYPKGSPSSSSNHIA